jgi:hypothetical protein
MPVSWDTSAGSTSISSNPSSSSSSAPGSTKAISSSPMPHSSSPFEEVSTTKLLSDVLEVLLSVCVAESKLVDVVGRTSSGGREEGWSMAPLCGSSLPPSGDTRDGCSFLKDIRRVDGTPNKGSLLLPGGRDEEGHRRLEGRPNVKSSTLSVELGPASIVGLFTLLLENIRTRVEFFSGRVFTLGL